MSESADGRHRLDKIICCYEEQARLILVMHEPVLHCCCCKNGVLRVGLVC